MANHKKNAGWRRPVKEENVQIGDIPRSRKSAEMFSTPHSFTIVFTDIPVTPRSASERNCE